MLQAIYWAGCLACLLALALALLLDAAFALGVGPSPGVVPSSPLPGLLDLTFFTSAKRSLGSKGKPELTRMLAHEDGSCHIESINTVSMTII